MFRSLFPRSTSRSDDPRSAQAAEAGANFFDEQRGFAIEFDNFLVVLEPIDDGRNITKLQIGELQNAVFYLLPGLIFGLVVAVTLWRRGLAGRRPGALFVVASIIAWPAAYYTGGSLLLAIDAKGVLRLAAA